MAEVRIVASLTLTHKQPRGTYRQRKDEVDLIEIRFGEVLIRMTVTEFDYMVQEVNNARPH